MSINSFRSDPNYYLRSIYLIHCFIVQTDKKVQVGSDQEKAQSEINYHSKN